tara:strand:+ start:737 stop:1210 length:474 start_codon:yes stop_codon:yes gene_type:complete
MDTSELESITSQETITFLTSINPGIYSSAENHKIYPLVNRHNELFIKKNSGTQLYKYNWYTCKSVIDFHKKQSKEILEKTMTRSRGTRFEQIWFADNQSRALDYYYNFETTNEGRMKILNDYNRYPKATPAVYRFNLINDTEILDLSKLLPPPFSSL